MRSGTTEEAREAGAGPGAGALQGLRVIDLSANMTGPYATMILGDQGAEVIKVEPPAGDVIRRIGSGRSGFSAYFANLNRSKRSVVVDLRRPEAAEVIHRLLEGADVLVQNFRPGVVDRLGLGAEETLARHPRLVYVSISGFGTTGELATMPAYDHVVQAFSGMAALQAPKGGDPTLVRHGIVDKTTGLMAAEAILAALYARARTGAGGHVEISMLDVAVSLMWPDGMMNHTCLDDGIDEVPAIAGSFRLTATADGWVSLVTVTDSQWQGLVRAVGLERRLEDPDFSSLAGRLRNGGRVMREVGAILREMESLEVIELLRTHGVPCMPVLNLDELADRLDAVLPGTVERTEHTTLGRIQQPRPPVSFSGQRGPTGPAPDLGEDTDEVLAVAGLDPAEIEELRGAGVVA